MKRRTIAFAAATVAVVLVAAEGASYVGLFLAKKVMADPPLRARDILNDQSVRVRRFLADTQRVEEIDPWLGWRYRRGSGTGGRLVNGQGLRGLRQYASVAPDSVLRIAAFGDSFVYASEVRAEDSWTSQMEAAFLDLEVLNYGVPGYGVDQALLRFRLEGTRFRPSYVLMGFATDDLRRVVNVYRRFISPRERPLTKPRFLQTQDSLVLLPPPLRDKADYLRVLRHPRSVIAFGAYDQWYRPEIYENPLYDWSAVVRLATTVGRQIWEQHLDEDRLFDGNVFNRSSAAFALQISLFEQFEKEVRAAGARPLIVLFPDRGSLSEHVRGRAVVYQPLVDEMRRRAIDFVDLAAAFPTRFDDATLAKWFAPKGHYSPEGNRLIAQAIASEIRRRGNVPSGVTATQSSRAGT